MNKPHTTTGMAIFNQGEWSKAIRSECQRVLSVMWKSFHLKHVDCRSYDSHMIGSPRYYDVMNGRLFVWPTPDKNIRLDVEWMVARGPVVFPLPAGWLSLYKHELASAMAQTGVIV